MLKLIVVGIVQLIVGIFIGYKYAYNKFFKVYSKNRKSITICVSNNELNALEDYLTVNYEGDKKREQNDIDKSLQIWHRLVSEWDKNKPKENQCTINDSIKSLPTVECVKEWYKEGNNDAEFWTTKIEIDNETMVKEIYKALKYFINRWQ